MQFVLNIVFTGSVISLTGISFAIIYTIVRFFHFAHGIVFTAGAYFTFLFKVKLGFSLTLSISLALLLSVVLGCLVELAFYRPLRRRTLLPLIYLLVSLGTYIFLQNIVSILFGDETRSIRMLSVQEGLDVFGAKILPLHIVTISLSVVFMATLVIFKKKTRLGKSMSAVANDPILAHVSGINSDFIILGAFAIGSGLAGLAGILIMIDVDMTPTMGMHLLLMGVVAVIVGGVNSIPGIALASLLLSTAQHVGTWYLGSQWKDAIAFIILVIFLLFKPEGFFGKKSERAFV